MNKYFFTIFFLLTISFFCSAQAPDIVRPPFPVTVIITNVIKIILDITWIIAGSLAIISFAIAGIKLITSGGNLQKVSEARQSLIWGTVGVIVVLLAWSAIAILRTTLRV